MIRSSGSSNKAVAVAGGRSRSSGGDMYRKAKRVSNLYGAEGVGGRHGVCPCDGIVRVRAAYTSILASDRLVRDQKWLNA